MLRYSFYGRWTTVVHNAVTYELTYTSQLNNTDGVRDISYVVANVLKGFQGQYLLMGFQCKLAQIFTIAEKGF